MGLAGLVPLITGAGPDPSIVMHTAGIVRVGVPARLGA